MKRKLSEITIAGEWMLFAGADLEMFADRNMATMWTAGFACALAIVKSAGRDASGRDEFRETMERLEAEAVKAMRRSGGIQ